jgi:fucose permease
MTAEELAEIGPPPSDRHINVPWAKLFRSRQLWLIMLMYWCYVWGSMFYLTWFPTYLVKGRGLSEAEMGVYSSLPFIMGALGNLGGGFLCDELSRRLGLSWGRRLIGSASLMGSALLLLATALTTGKTSGVILLALGFGLMDCMLPTAWATCLDVGGRHAGAVTGAMNSAGQAGGVVCTVLFGYLVEAYGDYNVPLFPIAAMVFIAGVLFLWIDPTRPLVEPEPTSAEEQLACV